MIDLSRSTVQQLSIPTIGGTDKYNEMPHLIALLSNKLVFCQSLAGKEEQSLMIYNFETKSLRTIFIPSTVDLQDLICFG